MNINDEETLRLIQELASLTGEATRQQSRMLCANDWSESGMKSQAVWPSASLPSAKTVHLI